MPPPFDVFWFVVGLTCGVVLIILLTFLADVIDP